MHPDQHRFLANRMGARTYEFESSHCPMLSQPDAVLDVIRTAANAIQGAMKRSPERARAFDRQLAVLLEALPVEVPTAFFWPDRSSVIAPRKAVA